MAKHAHFVLVHGAFQTAACWADVETRLQAHGHTTTAVNLPGRDGDPTRPQSQTIEGYRDKVLAALQSIDEPVILAGHSFGGITISAAAEAAPERIARLVYIAAYLPRSGDTLQALSAEDKDSKFTRENFVLAPDYATAHVLQRDAGLIFANDAHGDKAGKIAASLIAEPLAAMGMPVTLTAARFGRVPRFYVHTKKDHAVSPSMQHLMIERTPVSKTYEIDTGHAPYATHPDRLADILIKIAHEPT